VLLHFNFCYTPKQNSNGYLVKISKLCSQHNYCSLFSLTQNGKKPKNKLLRVFA
jgi:hypothetical protein